MRSSASAAAECALAVLMVVMLAQQAEAGVTIILGGEDIGWTNKANIDYDQWMSSYKVKIGDTVQFDNYDSTDHTVVSMDKEGYDTCGKSGLTVETDTISPGISHQITFGAAGDRYYICDIPGHCLQGQKVYIQVLNKDGTVNTTATPKDPERPSAAPHQMPGFTWTSQLLIVVVSAFSLMMAAAATM